MPEEELITQETVIDEAGEPAELEDSGTSETDEALEGVPETDELQPESEKRPPKGVQRRIDELTREKHDAARERDEWKRIALGGATQAPAAPAPAAPGYADLPKPKSDDFETYDEYVEALADYKAEVKVRQVQERMATGNREVVRQQWHQQAASKYADWQQVFRDDLPISETMADVLLQSPGGIDLAYHLGNNPMKARQIFQLPPSRQAYELGKLEMQLASKPPPQKTKTGAPAPTSPVGGKETPAKKLDDMSYEEYKAFRERQMGWRK